MGKKKWTTAMIDARLREMISEELGIDEDAITADSHLALDLGAESLDFVEMIMRCEEDFKLEIDDDDTARFYYVRDLSKYLAKRLVAA